MKIFIIVFSVLVLLIGILLVANVKFKIYLSKSGYVIFKYLFLSLKYDFYGDNKLKPLKEKSASKKVETASKKHPEEKEGYFKKIYRQQGLVEGTVQVLSLIKLIISKFSELVVKSKAEKLFLDIKVASEEPSTTAIYYGGVCAVVYPAIGLLNGMIPVNNQTVNINADYSATESEIEFELILKLRVYKSIRVAFYLIKEFIQGGF